MLMECFLIGRCERRVFRPKFCLTWTIFTKVLQHSNSALEPHGCMNRAAVVQAASCLGSSGFQDKPIKTEQFPMRERELEQFGMMHWRILSQSHDGMNVLPALPNRVFSKNGATVATVCFQHFPTSWWWRTLDPYTILDSQFAYLSKLNERHLISIIWEHDHAGLPSQTNRDYVDFITGFLLPGLVSSTHLKFIPFGTTRLEAGDAWPGDACGRCGWHGHGISQIFHGFENDPPTRCPRKAKGPTKDERCSPTDICWHIPGWEKISFWPMNFIFAYFCYVWQHLATSNFSFMKVRCTPKIDGGFFHVSQPR